MSELVDHFDEYLRALTGEGAPLPDAISARDLQVAMAVLMVQVLRADLEIRDEEIAAVQKAVEEVLLLDHEDSVALMRLAAHYSKRGEATRVSIDRLDQYLTRQQRVELVEWLWRIAFADSELLAHEEYLIRKVSDALGLDTADLVEAKVRAREAL